ncbi:tetraspanin-2A [Acyrthosiphon pisum]|uniref:Tetraspanin n=1 Tax=Acyrthosiphon pisum TaxID=7029 RepID=A0A8R2NTD6_ACYPI|nr:tetraspanin-2A [Acyrthosiphon pisum]|eukprot:XP_001948324.3 PREDICTED: 23 kDa integral membrane protein [Acyrthosiphon pisum]
MAVVSAQNALAKSAAKLEKHINLLKYTIFCLSIVIWIMGIFLWGYVVYSRLDTTLQEWVDALEIWQVYLGLYVLIFASIVVIIAPFLSCFAVYQELSQLLMANAGVHLFSFFVLLLGSAVLLENTTTGSGIVSSIRESMTNLIMQSQNEYATNTLNMIQESIGCCGADGPNDYLSLRKALPTECRDTVTGNAFFYGCADEVTWFLEDKSRWTTNIAISIAALEMLICVLSVILVKALQKEEKFNYNR